MLSNLMAMKKHSYKSFLAFTIWLLLCSCQEQIPSDIQYNSLDESYERIMDGKRLWQITKIESDIARHFIYTYPDKEDLEIYTIESTSTDWLSQIKQARQRDPNMADQLLLTIH